MRSLAGIDTGVFSGECLWSYVRRGSSGDVVSYIRKQSNGDVIVHARVQDTKSHAVWGLPLVSTRCPASPGTRVPRRILRNGKKGSRRSLSRKASRRRKSVSFKADDLFPTLDLVHEHKK